LTLAEQELLNQMKPKGRYNITVARRHGVTIEQTDSIDDFYHLYLDTNRRQRITGRPKQYFRQLMKHLPKQAVVFIARYKLQPLACAVVIFWQDTVTYLYGGSAAEHRQVMAPYLLHWEIMLEAKKRGCKRYDLGAVAPVLNTESRIQSIYSRFQILDSRSRSLTKKYAGLTRFKQQFGGQTIHIIGSYDLIFKPWWYRLYRLTERARRS
jgi:lipid II:glycine glycyltransferase (peptidoglycan interpeptide bridge formation enzyme)